MDYLFVNDSGGKERSISFKRKSTSLTRQDFESQFKDNTFFTIKDYEETKLFVTSEEVVNERIEMNIETYFKNDTYLKIQTTYPKNDLKAKDELTDKVTSLRISWL